MTLLVVLFLLYGVANTAPLMLPVRPLLKFAANALVLVLPNFCFCTTTVTREEQEPQHCPVSSSATAAAAAYGAASSTSLARVAELLHPFSLQTFADDFWETKPLIVRGRCVV